MPCSPESPLRALLAPVAPSTNIVLTSSEPVNVAPGASTLACGGPNLPYDVTGSDTSTVTVNPAYPRIVP